ncbi:MAG: hypothetical protein GX594_08595 [Pirellulaceae bacterium]|nr:hypothetical protein [Pirellulaceae bacterium]
MKVPSRRAYIGLVVLLAASRLAAAGGPAPTETDGGNEQIKFIRIACDESKRPLSLDTAIVRLASKEGDRGAMTVDLIAAVHIADAKYYRHLSKKFDDYEVVLYEMVAAEGASKPRQGSKPGKHPVSLMQTGMKDLLDLEYQLDGIDYTRENMVHADMSPEQFAESMKQRGETATSMIARMMGYAMAKRPTSGTDEAKLLAALFDRNRAMALKRVFANQFADGDDATAALEGPDGSTLISGRNQVALDVLKKEIEAGKKKIAIFYGAGHMPDFLKRLQDDFGLTPVDTTWLIAWDLNP